MRIRARRSRPAFGCIMVLSVCTLLTLENGCSRTDTDADRLVNCAMRQARENLGIATCDLGDAQPFTVVLTTHGDLPLGSPLTPEQRWYVDQRSRERPGSPILVVFRSDGAFSRADYVGNYFEVAQPAAVKKESGESVRIRLEKGTRLPRIVGIE